MQPDNGYSDLIKDGELPVLGLRIVSYITQTGETSYRYRWAGDAAITEVIGLLELIKTELSLEALRNGREP